MRILIVEDSDKLRGALVATLQNAGHAVDAVGDGRRAVIHLRTSDYDAAVLDVGLPVLDGMEVLREVRRHSVRTAVLVLSARDTVADRVAGLRAGADDYLIKPFAMEELVARVEAMIRRRHQQASARIVVGDLMIDTDARQVTRAGAPIDLTKREFAILVCLALRAGKMTSRAAIEEAIYDQSTQVQSNAVDSAISHLRAKLNAGGRPEIILTKRGVGYVLSQTAPALNT